MSDKQLKVLCRFLIWLSIALLITFVGISNIFALEIKTIYPNNNFNQNANNYLKMNSDGTLGISNINLTIQGVSYGFYFTFQETITLNRTYTLIINFMDADLLKTFQSSYVHIQNCSGSSCTDSVIVSVTKNNNNANSNKLTIQFSPTAVGNYFTVGLASDGPPYQALTGISTYGIKNVQLDVTDTTQDIINNQTNNTNNIINNNNSNTQEIIDNQNQNTQDIIESNKVCNNYGKNDYKINNKMITSTGSTIDSQNFAITDYISIEGSTVEALAPRPDTTSYSCFYDSNKTLVSCFINSSSGMITIPDDARYVRFTLYKFENIPLFKVCTNGNQSTNNAINDLNDSINSTDFDVSGLDNAVGWLPAGPVDSILNLPLNLFNAYSTALGLTCSPLNIPLPYVNKNLPIPCLRSIFQEIGIYNWWEGFGYLAAAIILYNYLLNLYTWVDKTLTLRESTMPGYYDDNFGGGA